MCLYKRGKPENFEHSCTYVGVDKCAFHLAGGSTTTASIHTFYVALFAPEESSHKSCVTRLVTDTVQSYHAWNEA